MCMWQCVRACVRACACVHACACVRACGWVGGWVGKRVRACVRASLHAMPCRYVRPCVRDQNTLHRQYYIGKSKAKLTTTVQKEDENTAVVKNERFLVGQRSV